MSAGSKLLAVLVSVAVLTAMAPGATAGVAAAGAAQDCGFPVTHTDATGTEVTVEEKPESIVTLAPSAAQTVKEIGAWDRVVGVSQHASYLEGADEKANISAAGLSFVNVEMVVGLQPDLVLAPNVIPETTVEQLRDAGLTVYKFEEAETMADIEAKTRLTGELVGECENAEATADSMSEELAVVDQAVEGEDRPRVLYVSFGYTAGEGTFIDHMIEAAGGTNVAAEAGIDGFAQISDEVVAEQDPEWIIVNDVQGSPPDREAYQQTTAVQEDQILVIDANHLEQPAPRSVDAVSKMAQAFHPEAYEEAVATPTPTATPTGTATPTDTPTETQASTETPTPTAGTDEGSPGFGVTVALVALLGAALLAVRRQ